MRFHLQSVGKTDESDERKRRADAHLDDLLSAEVRSADGDLLRVRRTDGPGDRETGALCAFRRRRVGEGCVVRPFHGRIVHDIAHVRRERELQHGESEEREQRADEHELDRTGTSILRKLSPHAHETAQSPETRSIACWNRALSAGPATAQITTTSPAVINVTSTQPGEEFLYGRLSFRRSKAYREGMDSMSQVEGGIYARISNKDDKAPKTQIQVAICKRMAEQDGVNVKPENIFIDDGIAASGKEIDDTTIQNRPGAQGLLKAMSAGGFKRLYAVEGERLARNLLDGAQLVSLSAKNGITWHLDTDGAIDPATPAGEATAMDIFMSGRREGRVRDERQRRRYERELAEGNPLWNTRAFGYKKDGVTLKKKEADLIRRATEDYLAGGRSMIQIAKNWTASGMLTDGMKRERRGRDGVKKPARPYWTATTVHRVLLRPRNAGILIHKGVRQSVSRIQPIITEEQHEELKARVKLGTPVGARATSLLGGVLRCECGAPMHSTVSYSQRKGGPRHVYRHYKCSQTIYDKKNKHASIVSNTVDDLITSLILKDLFNGLLKAPEGESTRKALKAAGTALEAIREGIAHLGEMLSDPDLKRFHAKYKADLKKMELEESELLEERDILLQRSGDMGGFEAFLAEWKDGSAGFENKEEYEEWITNFWTAWNAISNADKQALIQSRYQPSVKLGGRGIERVTLNAKRIQ